MGFKPPHDLATDSKSFSISGAHLMNDRFQKLYLGFCKIHCINLQKKLAVNSDHTGQYSEVWFTLMSSMKVIRRPQGCGRLTIRRSKSTLVICSWTISCQRKKQKYQMHAFHAHRNNSINHLILHILKSLFHMSGIWKSGLSSAVVIHVTKDILIKHSPP
jgi:hypothetical protein